MRPPPRQLTEYYLMISAGGALGGIFVSLIAPHLFVTFLEWNLGLILAYCVALAAWLIGFRDGVARSPMLLKPRQASSCQPEWVWAVCEQD